MDRKQLWSLAAALGFTLALLPAAAGAQAIGICTVGNTCSIETRLPGQDLCNDGIDNDGNGFTDANDPHCQAEVLCEDGFDNDGDGSTDAADLDCRCVRVAASLPGGNACTANDITVSYTANPIVSDGCINSNDTVVAQLTATITTNPERWDLGMWISLAGGDALDGPVCSRQALIPVSATPDPLDPNGDGPFNNIDGDRCGDRQASSQVVYRFPYAVNVPCEDFLLSPSGQGGFIDLGQCGSWVQPAQGAGNPNCQDPGDVVPGTSSKCNCSRGETGIPGPNLRKTCDSFSSPSGLGANNQLDVGETATFAINYTNTVANCTPGAPTVSDPFGRYRCGTASFVRMVIGYGTADARGDFYVNNGGGDIAIPTCPSTVDVDTDPTAGTNLGVICNDTAGSRLIFAPRDVNSSNTYGVVSPFSGTQTLPIKYTLTSNTNPPTGVSLVSRLWWDDAVDTSPTDSAITTAEAVDLTGAIEQNCGDCNCSTAVQATPVTLSSFQATPAGRGVRFGWTTDTEVGNVGFNLYAMVDGERVKLNDEPISSHGGDSLEPQRYDIELALPVDADSFVIEDVDIRGETRSHGPFKAGKKHGAEVEIEPIDWSAVRREHGLSRSSGGDRVAFRGHEKRYTTTSVRGAKSAPSPAPPTIELMVDRSGLHRVTYEQLSAAGFDLAGQQAGQLGLSVRGTPVPIFVGGGTKFGPGSYLDFWGEALDTLYTKTNVYRLATGVKKPARAAVSTAPPSGSPATTYIETRKFERNRIYAFWSDAGDPFYDTAMRVFTTPGQTSFPFTIDGFDASGGDARLRVELYGTTSMPDVNPDHHVVFLVNGFTVGESWFDGNNGIVFEGTVPSSVLVEGSNTFVIRQPADTGASMDIVALDEFSVSYPRRFQTSEGRLHFAGVGERFDVPGLSSGDVVAYRRDGSSLTRLAGATAVAEGGSYRASLPGSAAAAEFAVATESTALQAKAIQAMRPAIDISSGSASYLIVSHSAFVGGLDELVAVRSARGHTVRVVDVEDIYAQFAHGVFDPEAIRAYLAHAYAAMGTRFVLLVGGDSYDYHGYLGTGAISFLPTLYRGTGEIVQWAPADGAYADVDGDGVQDFAIGRFPVRSADELANAIAKTIAYESRATSPNGVFAADIFDAKANESFSHASDRVISGLSSEWQVNRVYIDDLGVNAARTKLFGDLQQGPSLTLFLGHSGNTAWGSVSLGATRLLTVNDVATLPNLGTPTIVAQVGCWNNYFVHPQVDSIGGRLFSVQDRGAAAVLGSGTLTDDKNNNRFGALLAPLLVQPGSTLGESLWRAKQALAAEAGSNPGADLRDVLFGWSLLGDPALVLTP